MTYNYPYSSMQYGAGMQPSQFAPQSNYQQNYSSRPPYPANSRDEESGGQDPSSSTAAPTNSTKKKRKAAISDDEAHDSHAHSDHKKRTKTARACDSCRSRKIRCDIMIDSDPQICKHCKQYGFECTFFLPITETRFKRKKTEDDAEKAQDSAPRPETSGGMDQAPHRPISPSQSQAAVSTSQIFDSYDLKYHHKYEVSLSSKGLIQVVAPEESSLSMPASLDPRIERDTVEQLINAYFTHIMPDFPVVVRKEFLSNPKPDPMLLYSMCLVAATRREVPQTIFETIRNAVNTIIKVKDVLSTPTLANVQALLILSMSADCHSQFVPSGISAVWIRLGAAIRMAQDIGLHRAESNRENIELRRRVWAACIIADRWTSVAFGHPSMIAVEDCDVCLPCAESIEDKYSNQLARLSLLVGRINRTMYGPSGLNFTSDEALHALLADLEDFKLRLPPVLQFCGPTSSRQAGLIHLLYSCACMLFWRVFMRISYRGPNHLAFHLTPEKWTVLTTYTAEAIEWLDKNDHCYDTWMTVAYAAVSCALVQYHTFVRRRDESSAGKLRILRDMLKRWETSVSTEHMSSRRKMAEIVNLLYGATQGPSLSPGASAPNLPDGNQEKIPQKQVEYRPDPSKPNSGVFIGHLLEDVGGATVLPTPDTSTQAQRSSSGVDPELLTSSAFAPPLPSGSSSVSNADLAALFGNINPIMNTDSKPTDVHILNALETTHTQEPETLSQLASIDMGYLEGMPSDLWNFPQWDEYFSRFAATTQNGALSLT